LTLFGETSENHGFNTQIELVLLIPLFLFIQLWILPSFDSHEVVNNSLMKTFELFNSEEEDVELFNSEEEDVRVVQL